MALTSKDLDQDKLAHAMTLACEGKPYTRIIEALGIPVKTFYNIKASDTVFCQAITQAREQGAAALMESLLTIVEDNEGLDPNLLRIKVDATKFVLTKAYAHLYGDQLTIKQQIVSIGGAIEEARSRAYTINVTPAPALLEESNPFD